MYIDIDILMCLLPGISQTVQNYYHVCVCFFLSSERHIHCCSLGLHGMFFVIAERMYFGKSLLGITEPFISKREFLLPHNMQQSFRVEYYETLQLYFKILKTPFKVKVSDQVAILL